ncbi:MAG: Ig-like domain-containing protein [Pseudomonadota bacterium]
MTEIIKDIENQTQYILGENGKQLFSIGGKSTEYGFSVISDGGIVVWNQQTGSHDILYDVEYLQFSDKTFMQLGDNIVECQHNDNGGSSQNQVPDAKDDTVSGTVGEAITLSPLSNDTDADGDALTITQINGIDMQPGWQTWVNGVGLVTLNEDFSVTVEPQDGVEWAEFSYTVSDGKGGTDTANIEFDVKGNNGGTNEAPVATKDFAKGEAGATIQVAPLENDVDADGDVLTITQINGIDMQPGWQTWVAEVGLVTLNEDNTLSIEPMDGLTKAEFKYTVSDGNGGIDVGHICVEIEESPQTDTVADNVSIWEDMEGTFNVLDNDVGQGLKLVNIRHETAELDAEFISRGGSISFDQDGNVTYLGIPNYYGNDKLVYIVEDAEGNQFSETVHLTIDPVSDAPILVNFPNTIHPFEPDTTSPLNLTFEGRVDDSADAVQQFGDLNVGVESDVDIPESIIINGFTRDVNVGFARHFQQGGLYLDGVLLNPALENGPVEVSIADIEAGKLAANVRRDTGFGIEFQVKDSGVVDPIHGGEVLSDVAKAAIVTPIAVDLSGDGKIGVTGETSSYDKSGITEIGRTVEFDIDADGEKELIEWFDGSGDGILVDLSKIDADGNIDGSALFGDEGGKFGNGFEKLELQDADGDGSISGEELANLGLWIDDGDAVLEEGELQSAAEANVTSVSTEMDIVRDVDGRALMQSQAVVDGETVLTEDVWFSEANQSDLDLMTDEDVSINPMMDTECLV